MTTIAYRKGILAADSRCTLQTEEGGARVFNCEKLFRKTIATLDGREEVILATAGESSSGMVFVDWYGTGADVPEILIHGSADFTVLILKKDGLYEADAWCRPIKIIDEFYAVGSGAKAALAAMHMGASAEKAVEIACRIDPYSAGPIVTMRLSNGNATKPKRAAVPKVRQSNVGRDANTEGKAPVAVQVKDPG